MFSVVIPVYNNFALVNDLLVNLFTRSKIDEVIVVDDCSPDLETVEGLKWWAASYGVKVVRPGSNLGFLRAANMGMGIAQGDILCLLSSDVIVETDLFQAIRDKLSLKTLIGGIVYNGSTGWNQFGQRIFPYAEGWLLACTSVAWKDIGGFDERYCPNDFEDVDLSTTAISKGYGLVSLNNPGIRHIGGQTIGYTEERMELTEKNRKKFEDKWVNLKTF